MRHAQFLVALEARIDFRMRPRDCSVPPYSAADQQSSAEPLPLERCDSTPFANTEGLLLWQEQVPATPADIGFASSATACWSRSEERRVGKECRSGWWEEVENKRKYVVEVRLE